MTVSGSYVRRYQFAQSLRNPESIVGSIFPADLYLGAGIPGVPVGRSDQGVIAAEYRPAVGMRLGIQGYARRLDGLLLVAPRAGEPFSTGDFATGSGVSRGVSLDAALTSSRLGLLASYGLQHVRLDGGGISYVPDHGATHLLEAGVIVFPSATSSLRLGVTSELGRRTTTASGGLEWEACNLLDRGCEFGGSPQYGGETLGGTALPGIPPDRSGLPQALARGARRARRNGRALRHGDQPLRPPQPPDQRPRPRHRRAHRDRDAAARPARRGSRLAILSRRPLACHKGMGLPVPMQERARVDAPALIERETPFHESFVALFDAHFQRLYRYLDRVSGDPELAADLAQEAFIKLYRRGSLPDRPEAWLISVAMNLFRNARSSRTRRRRLLTLSRGEGVHSDPPPSPEEATARG